MASSISRLSALPTASAAGHQTVSPSSRYYSGIRRSGTTPSRTADGAVRTERTTFRSRQTLHGRRAAATALVLLAHLTGLPSVVVAEEPAGGGEAQRGPAEDLTDLWARIGRLDDEVELLSASEVEAAAEGPAVIKPSFAGKALKSVTLFCDGILDHLHQETVFLFVGFAMVLQWHVLDLIFPSLRPSARWRSLGVGIVVLQIYYNSWVKNLCKKTEHPFLFCAYFMFFDCVGIWGILRISRLRPEKKLTNEKLQASNVYMDMSKPLFRCVVTASAQMILVLFYVHVMNDSREYRETKDLSMVKWAFAMAVIQVAGDDESGAPFEFDFWRSAWKRISPLWNDQNQDNRVRVVMFLHFIVRCALDFLINSACRTMILGTVPVMLATEKPLEFIKDVTAIFFIIKLDDLDDCVDLAKAETWSKDSDFDMRLPMSDHRGLMKSHFVTKQESSEV